MLPSFKDTTSFIFLPSPSLHFLNGSTILITVIQNRSTHRPTVETEPAAPQAYITSSTPHHALSLFIIPTTPAHVLCSVASLLRSTQGPALFPYGCTKPRTLPLHLQRLCSSISGEYSTSRWISKPPSHQSMSCGKNGLYSSPS
jgi:hypothetical protein